MLIALLFALAADVARIAATVDARVGVAAVDLESGRTLAVDADEAFPMASVVKLPLAVEVLHQVDHGTLRLDQKCTLTPHDFSRGHSPIRDRAKGQPVTLTLRELLVAAVSDSDNSAGDYLLRLVNPVAITVRMRFLGVHDIRVDRPENEIIDMFATPAGTAEYAKDRRDTATPAALVKLLRAIYEKRDRLSPASHALLMEMLTKSANPVRIGRLLPTGSIVAHKTGTMPGTLNDAGIITSPDRRHHIVIAILTKGAKTSSEAARERVVSEIARAIFDAWV